MLTDTHVKFSYDTDKHLTTCTRNVHNRIYIGHSQCHPHDYDFESKLVGQHYAYTRSMIREMCAVCMSGAKYYIIRTESLFGALHSLVVRLLWEQNVGGSNPLAPTNFKRY